jgi:hypothetical protein
MFVISCGSVIDAFRKMRLEIRNFISKAFLSLSLVPVSLWLKKNPVLCSIAFVGFICLLDLRPRPKPKRTFCCFKRIVKDASSENPRYRKLPDARLLTTSLSFCGILIDFASREGRKNRTPSMPYDQTATFDPFACP